MAWAAPRTWVVGEMVNAALLNQYLRDNLASVRAQAGCRLSRAGAAVSIPNNANTIIQFDTADFDTAGMADLVNNRINFTQAGKFVVGLGAAITANATGSRRARLFYHDSISGSDFGIGGDGSEGYVASYSSMFSHTVIDAKTGDYIYGMIFQNSGAGLNMLVAAPTYPAMWAVREGY